MSTIHDDQVIKLQQKVATKKSELTKLKKFTPVTTLSLELDGIRHNLHVLNKEQMIGLMVKLNAYHKSAIELGVEKDYNFSGFNITQWIADVRGKSDLLSVQDKERELKAMEATLSKLLSPDKQTEIEIAKIAALLED